MKERGWKIFKNNSLLEEEVRSRVVGKRVGKVSGRGRLLILHLRDGKGTVSHSWEHSRRSFQRLVYRDKIWQEMFDRFECSRYPEKICRVHSDLYFIELLDIYCDVSNGHMEKYIGISPLGKYIGKLPYSTHLHSFLSHRKCLGFRCLGLCFPDSLAARCGLSYF